MEERVRFTEAMEASYLGPCPSGYPTGGFLDFAFGTLGVTDPEKVLHFFGGGVRGGVTVDIRPETNPTVCCDVTHTPFEDASFDWIMADGPITNLFNMLLYGIPTKVPDEKDVLAEARRLLRPGGAFGTLHPIVPEDIEGLVREKSYAVITEPGRMVCGWHVMRRVN
jgi:SAM-dependent methyltransferase